MGVPVECPRCEGTEGVEVLNRTDRAFRCNACGFSWTISITLLMGYVVRGYLERRDKAQKGLFNEYDKGKASGGACPKG